MSYSRRQAGFGARAAAALLAGVLACAPAGAATTTSTSTSTNTNTATQTAPPPSVPVPSGQSGAQNQAGNANNMASMLGKAAGILSMASGGLHIARGAQELSCCMSGCKTDAGVEAGVDQAAQKAAVEGQAGAIKNPGAKRQPIDYFKLRFPDEARCQPRTPFLLIELFRPLPARASGCVDGMIALATGGLMMLNGILGLAAANQAADKGAAAMGNAAGMSSISGMPTGGATSPTPDSANTGPSNTNLGAGSVSLNTVKMDPALLRTGTANDIMGQFEKKFGIQRENFAERVFNSEDPRNILTSAPRNPIKVADMNKAISAAQQMSDSQKANALAGTQLAAAQRELAGTEVTASGGPAPAAAKSLFEKDKEEELVPIAGAQAQPALDDLNVSPEVKAALLARELEESKKLEANFSIFQIVHRKYVEKTKMIFGYDPGAKLKGVGDANGY